MNTSASITRIFDEGWQTRISKTSNAGQVLFIHSTKSHTWTRPSAYDTNYDHDRQSNSILSYDGSKVSIKREYGMSETAANNKLLSITMKKDQSEQLQLMESRLNEIYFCIVF